MKKVLFVGMVFGALALTSCKKDYTCECKVETFGTTTPVNVKIEKSKKKDAKDKCESIEKNYNSAFTTGKCELK